MHDRRARLDGLRGRIGSLAAVILACLGAALALASARPERAEAVVPAYGGGAHDGAKKGEPRGSGQGRQQGREQGRRQDRQPRQGGLSPSPAVRQLKAHEPDLRGLGPGRPSGAQKRPAGKPAQGRSRQGHQARRRGGSSSPSKGRGRHRRPPGRPGREAPLSSGARQLMAHEPELRADASEERTSRGRGMGEGRPSKSQRSERPSRRVRRRAGDRGVLRQGSRGRAVRAVQRSLGTRITGSFDRRTRRAVKAFQRRAGLQVDGIVGHQVVAAVRGSRNAHPGELTGSDLRALRRSGGAGRGGDHHSPQVPRRHEPDPSPGMRQLLAHEPQLRRARGEGKSSSRSDGEITPAPPPAGDEPGQRYMGQGAQPGDGSPPVDTITFPPSDVDDGIDASELPQPCAQVERDGSTVQACRDLVELSAPVAIHPARVERRLPQGHSDTAGGGGLAVLAEGGLWYEGCDFQAGTRTYTCRWRADNPRIYSGGSLVWHYLDAAQKTLAGVQAGVDCFDAVVSKDADAAADCVSGLAPPD